MKIILFWLLLGLIEQLAVKKFSYRYLKTVTKLLYRNDTGILILVLSIL